MKTDYILVLAAVVLIGMFTVGCSSGGSDTEQKTPSEKVTALVKADSGGVVTLSSGLSIQIEPFALNEDTNISLSSIDISQFDVEATLEGGVDGLHIVGAVFEPDGILLNTPAVVSFPLPKDWVNDKPLDWYAGPGSNPLEVLPTSQEVTISGVPGAYFAEVKLSHFSFGMVSHNCHSGTFRNITEKFIERGCTEEQITDLVEFFYDGIEINSLNAESVDGNHIQAFLDSYFDSRTPYDIDEPITSVTIEELKGYIKDGRQVAIAFETSETWAERSSDGNKFYPSLAHTANLEIDENGVVQMRHTIAYSQTKNDLERYSGLLSQVNMGPTLSYTYPLDEINEYRTKLNGLAFKEYVQANYPDTMTEEDFTISNAKYNSVNIYIEKSEGLTESPCAEIHAKISSNKTCVEVGDPIVFSSEVVGGDKDSYLYKWDLGDGTIEEGFFPSWTHTYETSGSKLVQLRVSDKHNSSFDISMNMQVGNCDGTATVNMNIEIPDYTHTFSPVLTGMTLGTLNDGPKIYPGVEAISSLDILSGDIFAMWFSNLGLGVGTHEISEIDFFEEGGISLLFSTADIVHEDDGGVVIFEAISGTITLEYYGVNYGDRLKGTISDVILEGQQNICLDIECDDPINNNITGSLSGSFDGTIKEY